MKRTRAGAALATAVYLLMVAPAAEAKFYGVEGLRISGPSLKEPIVIGTRPLIPEDQWDPRILLTADLVAASGPDKPIAADATELPVGNPSWSPEQLGSNFKLTYTVGFAVSEWERVRIVQHLYPFAAGGPVAFVPSGQSIPDVEGGRTPVPDGWAAYPQRALRVLRNLGLPRTPPKEATDTAGIPIDSGLETPVSHSLISLLVIGALAGIVVFSLRRMARPA